MKNESQICPEMLLKALKAFVKIDAVEHLPPYQQFRAKVAVNLLGVVQREIQQGAERSSRQLERLQKICKTDSNDIAPLNIQVAQGLRKGEYAISDIVIEEHVKLAVEENLKVSNPRWF
jgi:Domain of unknown function (DUF6285)